MDSSQSFKQWFQDQLKEETMGNLSFQHYGNVTELMMDNQSIGSIETGEGGSEKMSAKRLFPDVYDGGRIRRIYGIAVDEKLRGRGLGQLLYLYHFAQNPQDWYYNSQTWPDATNVLKRLSEKGLIEIHWHGRPPSYNTKGGVHLVKITQQGLNELDRQMSLMKIEG